MICKEITRCLGFAVIVTFWRSKQIWVNIRQVIVVWIIIITLELNFSWLLQASRERFKVIMTCHEKRQQENNTFDERSIFSFFYYYCFLHIFSEIQLWILLLKWNVTMLVLMNKVCKTSCNNNDLYLSFLLLRLEKSRWYYWKQTKQWTKLD